MDIPLTKDRLIELIHRERTDWEKLVAEIGNARMNRPGLAGDWTFKDVAAHLTAWRRSAIERLRAARLGEKPPPPPWEHVPRVGDDFEPINQWLYQQNRNRPVADVLREALESLQQLEEAVQALSEQDLTDPLRFSWMGGASLASSVTRESMDHFYGEHEALIRAWLRDQIA